MFIVQFGVWIERVIVCAQVEVTVVVVRFDDEVLNLEDARDAADPCGQALHRQFGAAISTRGARSGRR